MDTTPNTEQQERPRCKNCSKKLAKKGAFCPHCGQRDFDGRVRLREIFGKFFHNLTHLDGKFARMVWHLLVPAKVSIAYFQGRIQRYPHPVQFYFVTAFFFLLLLNKTIEHERESAKKHPESLQITVNDDQDTSINRNLNLDASELFPLLTQYEDHKAIRAAYDSLPEAWRSDTGEKALDSILSKVSDPKMRAWETILIEANSGKQNTFDTIPLSIGLASVNIATKDLVRYAPEEIIERYHIQGFLPRMAVKQGIKSLKDPQALTHHYLGSLTWAMLLLMAVMAGVLLLFFKKRRGYYAEHFVFLLHQSSSELLVLSLALATNLLLPLRYAWLLPFLWIPVSMGIAMRRFYGQGGRWFSLKYVGYYTLYLLFGLLFFVLSLFAVFALF
jgi:hypothetical protein